MRLFMDIKLITKFLNSIKSQLVDSNSRSPENNSKVGFGFTDFLSPDDEIKIINEISKSINKAQSLKEFENAYNLISKINPNLKADYKRLKRIPNIQKSIISDTNRLKQNIDTILLSCQQLAAISHTIDFHS